MHPDLDSQGAKEKGAPGGCYLNKSERPIEFKERAGLINPAVG